MDARGELSRHGGQCTAAVTITISMSATGKRTATSRPRRPQAPAPIAPPRDIPHTAASRPTARRACRGAPESTMPACGRVDAVAPPPPSHRMSHAASVVTVPVIYEVAIPETSSRRAAALCTLWPAPRARSGHPEPHTWPPPHLCTATRRRTKRPPHSGASAAVTVRGHSLTDGPCATTQAPKAPPPRHPTSARLARSASWWSASSTPGQGAPYGRASWRYTLGLTRGN